MPFVPEKYYPFRVWLMTLIAGPFFYLAYEILLQDVEYAARDIRFFLLDLPLCGILFSLPVFLIYWLLFYLFQRFLRYGFLIKFLLSIFPIAGVAAVLSQLKKMNRFVIQEWTPEDITLLISYSLAIILFGFACRIKRPASDKA